MRVFQDEYGFSLQVLRVNWSLPLRMKVGQRGLQQLGRREAVVTNLSSEEYQVLLSIVGEA